MPDPDRKPPWYRLTPDRLVVGLILAEGGLWLANRFYWFGLSRGDFWNLQLAARLVVGFGLLGFVWLVLGKLLERRPQFGIRCFLLFTLAVALVGSWYAAWVENGRRQKAALAVVRQVQSRICQGKRHRRPRYDTEFITTKPARRDFVAGISFAIEEDAGCGCCYVDAMSDVSDRDLSGLGCFHRLERLAVPDARITDAGLAHLSDLKNLRDLDLSGNPITDAGLPHLGGLKNLEHLNLSNTEITDAAFVHLRSLKKLQQIEFNSTSATGVELSQLAGCRAIKKCAASLSPEGVCTIDELPTMEELHADVSRFPSGASSLGSIRLDGHPALRVVDLRNCLQLESVRLSNLPALAQFQITVGPCVQHGMQCRCPREVGIVRLEDLPKLESLTVVNVKHLVLRDVPGLTEVCLVGVVDYEHIREVGRLSQLQSLSIRATGLLSPDVFAVSGRLANLNRLTISGAGLTDESLAWLEQYPALECLSLPAGQYTEQGLSRLRAFASLEHLSVDNVRDVGEPLACLAELPSLKTVTLFDCMIGTLKLVDMPKLQRIALRNVHIGTLELAGLSGVSQLQLEDCSVQRISVRQLPLLRQLAIDVADEKGPPQTIELEALPGLTYLALPGLVKEPVFSDDTPGQFTALVDLSRHPGTAAVSDRRVYRLVESASSRWVYAREANPTGQDVDGSL